MSEPVAKVKIKYSFNNPNTAEDTACMLLDFFVMVNTLKVEEAIKNAAKGDKNDLSNPA